MTAVGASTGLAVGLPLEKRCQCPGGTRRLPLRMQMPGVLALHGALKASAVQPDGNAVVLTYRCSGCRQTVALTVRDLFLAD